MADQIEIKLLLHEHLNVGAGLEALIWKTYLFAFEMSYGVNTQQKDPIYLAKRYLCAYANPFCSRCT